MAVFKGVQGLGNYFSSAYESNINWLGSGFMSPRFGDKSQNPNIADVLNSDKGRKWYIRLGISDKEQAISSIFFAGHLKGISLNIDMGLWMFIQSMASHAHVVFQESFEKKSFFNQNKWTPLAKSTQKHRKLLGFEKDNILSRTGRLKKSLILHTNNYSHNKAGKTAFIYTSPNVFKGAYPEWLALKSPTNPEYGVTKYTTTKLVKDGKGHRKRRKYLIVGRKGRVYAGAHNCDPTEEGIDWGNIAKKPPTRRFMGYMGDTLDDIEDRLMDMFLFYNIFDRVNTTVSEASKKSMIKQRDLGEGRLIADAIERERLLINIITD